MEKTYLITFIISDVNTTEKVTDAIKLLGKWWNYIGNIWIIKTDSNASTIKNYLKVFLDKNDRIIILGLNGEADWNGIDHTAESWLTNFLVK